MRISSVKFIIIFLSLTGLIGFIACNGGGNPPPNNPCSGVTVSVSTTTTNPTAGSSNGSITASATGGSGFTYSINGGSFQSSGAFGNLGAGSYTITAKNSNGCSGTINVTLTAINPCAGVTITVTGTTVNPTTATSANGSITANASGGTGSFTFSIDGTNFVSTNVFANLGAGNYTITAKDTNGCTGTGNFSLISPCAGITISVSATLSHPTTQGGTNGSINTSASGGTGPYNYSLNNGAFQTSGIFNNLMAGNYTITAKDAIGCTGSTTITLTDPDPCATIVITQTINTTAHVPCTGSNNGSITSLASGGLSPYTYSLNNGAFQSSGIFNNLAAGNYTVTAKDANNCLGTANTTVATAPAGPLFTQVRTIIQNNCAISGCHSGTQPPDFRIDCNIVTNRDRIQARAVNGNPSFMPPTGALPAVDRQKITDWINAGGQFNN